MKLQKIRKVFLIDDDPVNNTICKLVIQKHRSIEELIVFDNGVEALQALQEASRNEQMAPDVLLLDIEMPGQDGWDFLEEYEKLPSAFVRRCLLYMLSSSINPPDIKRAGSHSLVKSYFAKPITARILNQIVNDYMDMATSNNDERIKKK